MRFLAIPVTLAGLLAACDNPLEKTAREQFQGPVGQVTSYAIDDLLTHTRGGMDCDWVRREAELLRARVQDDGARQAVEALRTRAANQGCRT